MLSKIMLSYQVLTSMFNSLGKFFCHRAHAALDAIQKLARIPYLPMLSSAVNIATPDKCNECLKMKANIKGSDYIDSV